MHGLRDRNVKATRGKGRELGYYDGNPVDLRDELRRMGVVIAGFDDVGAPNVVRDAVVMVGGQTRRHHAHEQGEARGERRTADPER